MKTVFHIYTHTTNNKNSQDTRKNKFADQNKQKTRKTINDNKMIKVILLIFS
jgi:hypothetical protein